MKPIRQKQQDAFARTLYIRELHKFVRRSVALLNKEETTAETFRSEIAGGMKRLLKVEKVPLTGYQEQVELLAGAFIAALEGEEPYEELRNRLLRAANQAEKTKTRSSYKKPKHKHAVHKEYE